MKKLLLITAVLMLCMGCKSDNKSPFILISKKVITNEVRVAESCRSIDLSTNAYGITLTYLCSACDMPPYSLHTKGTNTVVFTNYVLGLAPNEPVMSVNSPSMLVKFTPAP